MEWVQGRGVAGIIGAGRRFDDEVEDAAHSGGRQSSEVSVRGGSVLLPSSVLVPTYILLRQLPHREQRA